MKDIIYLSRASVKQRFMSFSVYLLHASTARGFTSRVLSENDLTLSGWDTCSSFKRYTPLISFPWVPPQTATLDRGLNPK